MKYFIIIIIFWVIQYSISYSQGQELAYNKVLDQLNNQKNILNKNDSNLLNTITCSNLLFKTLTENVFPAWYGTPWDFNGISNIPGKGEIACGYFVSTTLKHVGFNLNRYKLAQQASAKITEELCGKNQIKLFHSADKLIERLVGKAQKNGLYVVGLDYHVGFLVLENKEVFFIHSDYFSSKVIKENASTSESFQSSNIYFMGEITNNQQLMSKWLNETKIF